MLRRCFTVVIVNVLVLFFLSGETIAQSADGTGKSEGLSGYYRAVAEMRLEAGQTQIVMGGRVKDLGNRIGVKGDVLQIIIGGKYLDQEVIGQIPQVQFLADDTGSQILVEEMEISFSVDLEGENIEVTMTGDMTGRVNPASLRNIEGTFSGTLIVVWDDHTDNDRVRGSFTAWKLR